MDFFADEGTLEQLNMHTPLPTVLQVMVVEYNRRVFRAASSIGTREIISLHIGQAGVQTGCAAWQLFCLEYGIDSDGQRQANPDIPSEDDPNLRAFYSLHGNCKHISRALFVDTEPDALDSIRTGPYRRLFHPNQLLSGKENSAGLYSRGYHTAGREVLDICLDRIRRLADDSNAPQGFMVYHSVGGGTGSGLTSLLLEKLSQDYPKKAKLGFTFYPSSGVSTPVVEPYNSVLATHALVEYFDTTVVLQNEAISGICRRSLDIEHPTYTNVNQLIAQVISSVTKGLRFDSSLNVDLNEFQTNLVPYPHYHFLLASQAPFASVKRPHNFERSVTELTKAAFEPHNLMAQCDPRQGKYMAVCVTTQGDVVIKDLNAAICNLKIMRVLRFVDWAPTGFKCGLNYQNPAVVPGGDLAKVNRTVSTLTNSTAVAQVFSRVSQKFDLMFAKRAFVHWYVDSGMDESMFVEAREDLSAILLDYEELEKAKVEGDGPEGDEE